MFEVTKMGNKGIVKVEAFLRLLAFLTLFLAAFVVVVDSQTKVLFGYYKQKATYKMAIIAKMYVYVHFIGAGYSLLQFLRCLIVTSHQEDQLSLSSHIQKWTNLSIDQVIAYLVFATNCALTEMAFLVLIGSEVFQWMKLCDRFTRFCVQIGGAVFCGLVSVLLLVVISGISTFNLFRWYSPNFMCLKPKKIGIITSTT